MSYVIVTPYFRESPELLRRCIDNVAAQTVAIEHILVADGIPPDWIDETNVRHLRLDRSYADFGDTPRAVAALPAVSGAAAGFGFLDGDNWLEPGYIATPPPGATPNPPWAEINAWSAGLSPAERTAVRKLCGLEP
jgi:hypothetical protein